MTTCIRCPRSSCGVRFILWRCKGRKFILHLLHGCAFLRILHTPSNNTLLHDTKVERQSKPANCIPAALIHRSPSPRNLDSMPPHDRAANNECTDVFLCSPPQFVNPSGRNGWIWSYERKHSSGADNNFEATGMFFHCFFGRYFASKPKKGPPPWILIPNISIQATASRRPR